MPCKLYIDTNYYDKLNEAGKALFDHEACSNLFYTTFPAELENDSDLSECITAFCEVGLILFNDQYHITDDTDLSCEIFHLGQAKHLFTLVITIKYPNNDELFHDMMTFEILSQDETQFSFKLLGDQTLFSLEHLTSSHHY